MRKKYEIEERPIYNAVTVFRERGNYLQRLEQFEKAIQSYNEALRWNNTDVRSLLGRSLARAKATHYAGALADSVQAAELEPHNLTALQMRAQTEYDKCAFERALVLAHKGRQMRRFPPNFAECARCAEETIRNCVGKSASKVLAAATSVKNSEILRNSADDVAIGVVKRLSKMNPEKTHKIQANITLAEKLKANHISRLMSSKYLERMAHDKYFLASLCEDDRLASANKQGSEKLKVLASKALSDLEKRQAVLRERRPLYAACASEEAARVRLLNTRKQQITLSQQQHVNDAKRLVQTAQSLCEERETNKCLEQAEFGMDQIYMVPSKLLPGKEKYLDALRDIVGTAFLEQKRVRKTMSETDRERRAYILLGMSVSREPSHDSVLRVKPLSPPRNVKSRLRNLERALSMSTRSSERCYLLHELARLHVDTKKGLKARFYASKCLAEARASNLTTWSLNAAFLLASAQLQQNNRAEARAVLLEAAALARSFQLDDIAEFYDTCASVALEGDVGSDDEAIERREKDMVSLMQDEDLRSEAKHLFKRMSVLPAARRFSIMPGAQIGEKVPINATTRRMSIIPKSQQQTKISYKSHLPLGFQEFDI